MPLIETKGAASAQGFGEFTQQTAPIYIENVFSTWLYTGNGSTQTITNGIDLSGKGGLVWTKKRNSASSSYHTLIDTLRGTGSWLRTDGNVAAISSSDTITSFNASGYALGTGASYGTTNTNSDTYVSWTFREQPKFFDVVTYTGNGTVPRSISHSLGSVPGCVITKCTSAGGTPWITRHQSAGSPANDMTQYATNDYLALNSTGSASGSSNIKADATTFTVNHIGDLNTNGETYVAYLFAHDAGGFGLSGTDNVISCGSYTGDGGAGTTNITLGYEPQWIMSKRTDSAGNWVILDVMRGLTVTASDVILQPNTANAEGAAADYYDPTATGFKTTTSLNQNVSGATYIYIAIRRGPMKVPTTGTSVFSPIASTGPQMSVNTTDFVVDAQFVSTRGGSGGVGDNKFTVIDRLRGVSTKPSDFGNYPYLVTSSSAAEVSGQISSGWDNTGYQYPAAYSLQSMIFESFRRAPGFFDVVCYTGDGSSSLTVNHNLAAVPELMIMKRRNNATDGWFICALFGASSYQQGAFDGGAFGAQTYNVYYLVGKPTSTSFAVKDSGFSNHGLNVNGSTYVTYLFATCAGVSKVGTYTGTGALQTVDCGFAAGARFVLIKRTDSTGDWYVYDSARGISSGNDPYLLLNSTAAEVTGTNYVDTTSVGFQVTAAAPADLNANGGTYIFLAIA